MYERKILKRFESWLFKGKILILYGARQVGKTTFCKNICKKYKTSHSSAYYNCEDPLIQNALIDKNALQMYNFFGNNSLIVLDEAQSVKNIGRILKIFHDEYPDIQIIATGSSSFDLSNSINEPLTGRSIEFSLYPLSLSEIQQEKSPYEIHSFLPQYLQYGMYPEIIDCFHDSAKERIKNITQNYLFKDILNFEGIKNIALLKKILQALAYQIGSEVSFSELAKLLGSNQHTIEKYISLLEQSFIIFQLPAYSTNQRKEIRKSRKIYFYDIGIRNALIDNFGDINLRNDKGGMWENFCIIELLKNNQYEGTFSQFYFWRTYDRQEIDLIIKTEEKIDVFEIKWSPKKTPKVPIFFQKTYPDYSFSIINKENLLEYLGE
jgi:predicted AAA+ superfamily ATPase